LFLLAFSSFCYGISRRRKARRWAGGVRKLYSWPIGFRRCTSTAPETPCNKKVRMPDSIFACNVEQSNRAFDAPLVGASGASAGRVQKRTPNQSEKEQE
jgi:hypothetical protein